jgi:hypothetical protein
MAMLRNRLARLENELEFNRWFRVQRWLEMQTLEQLEEFVANYGTGQNRLYDPPLGSTPLDKLDRTELIKLWKKERMFWNRTSQEIEFFNEHGHWPERPCRQSGVQQNADKIANGEHLTAASKQQEEVR